MGQIFGHRQGKVWNATQRNLGFFRLCRVFFIDVFLIPAWNFDSSYILKPMCFRRRTFYLSEDCLGKTKPQKAWSLHLNEHWYGFSTLSPVIAYLRQNATLTQKYCLFFPFVASEKEYLHWYGAFLFNSEKYAALFISMQVMKLFALYC